jgi:hypothetical protein
MKKDLVGAHVMKVNGSADTPYIYPLCAVYSRTLGELEVDDLYWLVPATASETCESAAPVQPKPRRPLPSRPLAPAGA